MSNTRSTADFIPGEDMEDAETPAPGSDEAELSQPPHRHRRDFADDDAPADGKEAGAETPSPGAERQPPA
ncbi:hypothetical protein [Jiella sp. M17.18]|uniref:hypothetical protein n=1 Tax=Jiella sp. M17.18 TaxID=3234247 RepID=UPI0034E031C0